LLGEAVRDLLLANTHPIALETETLLMFASRQQLITEVIRPALAAGRWVVSDRFTDATFAYQGGGRGVAQARIRQLEEWVQQDLQPTLTLLFDVPLAVARQRVMSARAHSLDRFEQQDSDFYQRVRQAYLQRAQTAARFCVIDANRDRAAVSADIAAALQRLWELSAP
jgi:dTMP kinase